MINKNHCRLLNARRHDDQSRLLVYDVLRLTRLATTHLQRLGVTRQVPALGSVAGVRHVTEVEQCSAHRVLTLYEVDEKSAQLQLLEALRRDHRGHVGLLCVTSPHGAHVHHRHVALDVARVDRLLEEVVVLGTLRDERQQQVARDRVLEPLRVQRRGERHLVEDRAVYGAAEGVRVRLDPHHRLVRVLRVRRAAREYSVDLLDALLTLLLLVGQLRDAPLVRVALRQQVALSSLQLVHGQQRVVLLRLIPSPRAHFGAELVRFRCEFFDARLHRVQVLARAQLLLDGVQRLLRVAHLSLTSRRHTHLLTQLGSLDVDAHQRLLGALVDAVLLAALLHEGIDAGRGLLQILLLLRHAAHYDIITQLHALEVGNGLAVVIDLLAKRRVVFVDGLCVMARMSTPP